MQLLALSNVVALLATLPHLCRAFSELAPRDFVQYHDTEHPSEFFCSLNVHSSIHIANTRKLYIHGGELRYFNFTNSTSSSRYPPSSLWIMDMSKSWATADWQSARTLQELPSDGNNPSKRSCGVGLWMLEEQIIVYGGNNYTWPATGTSPLLLAAPAVYNPSGSSIDGDWTSPAFSQPVSGRGCGAWAQSDEGVGYYVGGTAQWDNDPTISSGTYFPSTSLLGIDLGNAVGDTTIATNVTGLAGVGDYNTTARGTLSFIPSYGEQGILVALAGYAMAPGQGWNEYGRRSTASSYNDMSAISVFDIANQTWYRQNTTGDIVPGRAQPCAVMVSAPDNSSHHIYVHGGYNNTDRFDIIHVLSIPLFQWTTINAAASAFRFAHSCNIVANRQMLVVGGLTSDQANWTLSNPWPDLPETCSPDQMFDVFDLTAHTWNSTYDADAAAYELNPTLVELVGGTPTGGATVHSPSGGFDDPRLAAVFNTTRKMTKPAQSHDHASKTALVGGIVGILALFGLLAGAVFFLWRRKWRYGPLPFIPHAEQERFDNAELDSQQHVEQIPANPYFARFKPETEGVAPVEIDGTNTHGIGPPMELPSTPVELGRAEL